MEGNLAFLRELELLRNHLVGAHTGASSCFELYSSEEVAPPKVKLVISENLNHLDGTKVGILDSARWRARDYTLKLI